MSDLNLSVPPAPNKAGHRWSIPGLLFSLLPLLAILVLAIVAPMVWHRSAEATDIFNPNAAISGAHPLGTDNLGRDVLSRVLVATRLSIAMALGAAAVGALFGCVYGVCAAIAKGRLQSFLLRLIDAAQALPGILVAVVITAISGASASGAVLAVGLAVAPIFARVSSSLLVTQMGQEYFANAKVVGVSGWRLVRKYVLPSIGASLAILATAEVGACLVAIASVSFLGLGVQPPQYDWGRLLVEGVSTIRLSPGLALGASLAIAASGLAFGLVGEVAAIKINPELRAFKKPRSGPWTGLRPSGSHEGGTRVSGNGAEPLLAVRDLSIALPTPDGHWVTPVEGVSFEIGRGEVVGLVGESGSGKSLTAAAVAGLLPVSARVRAAELSLENSDLTSREGRKALKRISVVFQDPMGSLNPMLSVGSQLTEPRRVHAKDSRRAATSMALQRLKEVRVPSPARRLKQRPHELSGGMRQRVVLAMGLMMGPQLLIADEPTTALDVTVQARLLALLKRLNAEEHMSILLISHDLAVIANICTRVLVMKDGKIVEDARIEQFLAGPAHPYSRQLLDSVPRLDVEPRRLTGANDARV